MLICGLTAAMTTSCSGQECCDERFLPALLAEAGEQDFAAKFSAVVRIDGESASVEFEYHRSPSKKFLYIRGLDERVPSLLIHNERALFSPNPSQLYTKAPHSFDDSLLSGPFGVGAVVLEEFNLKSEDGVDDLRDFPFPWGAHVAGLGGGGDGKAGQIVLEKGGCRPIVEWNGFRWAINCGNDARVESAAAFDSSRLAWRGVPNVSVTVKLIEELSPLDPTTAFVGLTDRFLPEQFIVCSPNPPISAGENLFSRGLSPAVQGRLRQSLDQSERKVLMFFSEWALAYSDNAAVLRHAAEADQQLIEAVDILNSGYRGDAERVREKWLGGMAFGVWPDEESASLALALGIDGDDSVFLLVDRDGTVKSMVSGLVRRNRESGNELISLLAEAGRVE